jgi:hypothetical protein
MEEKRYPQIDEEQSVGKVCEPIAEAAIDYSRSVDGITQVHDWIDDLDWDRFPSMGPFSDEEAIARIDRFEERLEKGEVNWTSSEDFNKQLYEEFPWLR